jgi:hypothetical protein
MHNAAHLLFVSLHQNLLTSSCGFITADMISIARQAVAPDNAADSFSKPSERLYAWPRIRDIAIHHIDRIAKATLIIAADAKGLCCWKTPTD